jgi:hypothetical protein
MATEAKWNVCLGDATHVQVPGVAKPINCGSVDRARLIAAAPDLYEALLGCVEHMEHSTPEGRVAYQIAKEVLASATPKAVRA